MKKQEYTSIKLDAEEIQKLNENKKLSKIEKLYNNAKDKEEYTIKETTKNNNFIIVYDTFYKNTQLTAQEIALFIKLKALAPTFTPTSEKLAKILNIEIRQLTKASKGLQAKGYLKIERDARTHKAKWLINDAPIMNIKEASTIEALTELNLRQLKELYILKIIDRKTLFKTLERQQEIAHTNWLDNEE